MYTASWSETLKASSSKALPKLPVTWSLPMPSAIVSYLSQMVHHNRRASPKMCRTQYRPEQAASNITMQKLAPLAKGIFVNIPSVMLSPKLPLSTRFSVELYGEQIVDGWLITATLSDRVDEGGLVTRGGDTRHKCGVIAHSTVRDLGEPPQRAHIMTVTFKNHYNTIYPAPKPISGSCLDTLWCV